MGWKEDPFKRYVAVGSRETPDEFLALQYHCGRELCDMGFQGTSGLAEGSDETYYEGAKSSTRFDEIGFLNFIPWNGFKSSKTSVKKHYADTSKLIFDFDESPFKMRAWILGVGARGTDNGLPPVENLSSLRGGHCMHGRNAHQLLGLYLDRVPSFLHCYARPIGKGPKVNGGTNTAVMLAHHFGVKVINLATPEGLRTTLDFLNKRGIQVDTTPFRKLLGE